jgi:hypothetical protein
MKGKVLMKFRNAEAFRRHIRNVLESFEYPHRRKLVNSPLSERQQKELGEVSQVIRNYHAILKMSESRLPEYGKDK